MSSSDGADAVVVTASKGRLALLALAALAFVVGGLWMAGVIGDGPSLFQGSPRPAVVVLGWLSVVVFGLALGLISHRLVVPRPALVIDAQGFTDSASASGAGRVAWHEVTSVAAAGSGQQRMIVVDLADEQAFLARQTPGRRRLIAASRAVTGHPVNIPMPGLSLSEEKILATIERFRAPAR